MSWLHLRKVRQQGLPADYKRLMSCMDVDLSTTWSIERVGLRPSDGHLSLVSNFKCSLGDGLENLLSMQLFCRPRCQRHLTLLRGEEITRKSNPAVESSAICYFPDLVEGLSVPAFINWWGTKSVFGDERPSIHLPP